MQRKNILIGGVIVGALVISFSGWYFLNPVKAEFKTVAAEKRDIVETVKTHGTISSSANVDLSFDRGGRIAGVYVANGSVVNVGDKLVSLENSVEAAQLAQAEAALNQRAAGATPEQVAAYQAAVNAAESALQKNSDGTSLITDQAHDNLVASFQQTLTALDGALSGADAIVAVDNTFANESFLTYLSAKDKTRLNVAINQYRVTKQAIADFRSDVSSNNITGASKTGVAALNATDLLLSNVFDALNASTPDGPLAQPNLDNKKIVIQNLRAAVSGQLSALLAAINANNSAATTLAQKQAAYDQAVANLKTATDPVRDVDLAPLRAAVASALANFNKTIIRSPVTGVVSRIDAKIGGVAAVNQPLVSVINPNNYQIETYISETDVGKIKVGDKADVTVDAYGSSVVFPAIVASVDQSATTNNGSQGYKIILAIIGSDTKLKSGMNANIVVTTNEVKNALSVPVSSVIQQSGKYYVLLKGTNEQREVTVGLKGDNFWEIKNGLNPNEDVFSFGK